jgi:hypothetical protein
MVPWPRKHFLKFQAAQKFITAESAEAAADLEEVQP